MTCDLDVIKAVAGPIATVVAAAAVVGVAIYFNKKQVAIAAAQANTAAAQKDIAYNKLRYDLFAERYAIYVAVKDMIERVIRTGTDRPVDDMELLAMRLKVEEATFFFPQEIVALFDGIDNLVTLHEVARASWTRDNEIDQIRLREADVMADAIRKLSEVRRKLPNLLKDELGFGRLKSDRSTQSA